MWDNANFPKLLRRLAAELRISTSVAIWAFSERFQVTNLNALHVGAAKLDTIIPFDLETVSALV
jgi:hypothetical protein